MKMLIKLVVAIVTILFVTQPVFADGIIIIDPPPEPLPIIENWLTIQYHRVTVTIEDQIAITKVDQVFRNDGMHPVEGTYIFPLPPDTVVQNFVMWVDGQPLESEILPADKARGIYEGYVRQRRDPALLEYIGRDAIQARIYPIPAKTERRIQLEYTQILPIEDSLMYYRYPLNTERFSAYPLEQVSIYVELKSSQGVRSVYSPSHQDEIVTNHHNPHYVTVSYEASNILPEQDFELYMGTTNENIGLNLLTHQPSGEDGFFLMLLTPAIREESSRILARDIFLVLDTSGSMEGTKLSQAKEALIYVLRHLNTEDRFNVIAFSSGTRAYAPQLQSIFAAEQAVDWIYTLEAMGGTNIYQGLSDALIQADDQRPTIVIFLTDGLPTEGIVEDDTLLNMLLQETPENLRIFPFGVGYDINTLLLDQLALNHKGKSAYVTPDEYIDEKISAFYARIQSPVLTNISLNFGSTYTYDIYPAPSPNGGMLPDLYAGTQLIITGRYTGDTPQQIQLSGDIEEEHKVYTYQNHSTTESAKDFIPRLWAARKIGHLLTQIRLHGENAEWIDAIIKLSLRYGLITPYTSFLVEEPGQFLNAEDRDRAAEEFMKAAPSETSGVEAVQDAEMRLGLGGAEAAPQGGHVMPDTLDENTDDTNLTGQYVRYAGDKTFICETGNCIDTTYVPAVMVPKEIVFMTDTYFDMLQMHPEWAAYFALADTSTFVAADGNAYHFRLGESFENSVPEEGIIPPSPAASPTPAIRRTPEAQPTPDTRPSSTPIPTPLIENDTPTVNLSAAPRNGCSSAAWLIIISAFISIPGYRRVKRKM
ncbi:MAG: VWA domain-containing protein [Anaerolineae bacterium]|nr:VWA domain-containing protein [Anaerolineae bacterium]